MRAFSNSQGSRTSSSSGGSRAASASQAASSGAEMLFIRLEAKARRALAVDERVDHRLEQLHRGVGARRGAGDQARAHRRGLADHGEQAPADVELLQE